MALKKATTREKKIWGRKRHLLVDTQGHLLGIKVTGAHRSDQEGGRALLLPLTGRFPRMTLVWGDSHYGGNFILWMLIQMRWRMETIKALTMPKANGALTHSEQEKEDKPAPSTFRPLPRRWVVERTIAWITRFRRLCRDHEGLPSSSEAFITIAMSSRIINRLIAACPSY